jgi:hypothetical protein
MKCGLFFLSLGFLLLGCASGYNVLRPESMKYTANSGNGGITSGYRHGVLAEAGNRKYAKYEARTGIKIVAIRITNNTDRTINVRRDLAFFAGDRPAAPLDTKTVKWKLNQSVPIYLLYLLLTPMSLNISNNNGTIERYPIGFAIGPGLTLLNMATAGSANAKFSNDLVMYSIDRDIAPGQGLFFLVGFEGISFEPLTVKVRE